MTKNTATIIKLLVDGDTSMTDTDRQRVMRFVRSINEPATAEVRKRIHTRDACDILGINHTTLWRWRKTKPHYAALTQIPGEGREAFFYLDEVCLLRDGKHPVTALPANDPYISKYDKVAS